jgi:hypothetical protein
MWRDRQYALVLGTSRAKALVGSTPTFRTKFNARMRREVIRLPYKESDTGSSPVPGTKQSWRFSVIGARLKVNPYWFLTAYKTPL